MNQEADILIKGGTFVTPGEKEKSGKGMVLIDGEIEEVAPTSYLKKNYDPRKEIDASRKIIMPGLVDGHIHNAQIMLRGSVNDRLASLPPVWLNYLIPFEKKLTKKQVKISSLFSMINMIKSGVTTFIEAGGPHPDEIAGAALESGMRGVVTKSTVDTDPDVPTYQETSEIIEEYEGLIQRWHEKKDRIQIWPSLREIMLNSLELSEGLFDLKEKYNTGLTMHLAESRTEVDYCLENYGKRPVELMHDRGYLDTGVVASHMIFLNDKEIGHVAESNVNVVWCPTVDAMVMGPSRAGELLEREVNVLLGSDGGVWNNMDLLEQARQARTSSKLVSNSMYHDKVGIDVNHTLMMLTQFGEKAVGKPIGKLEEGYRADIIVLDPGTNILPGYDPEVSIINMASAGNVETTIVNGEILMEDRELKSLDESVIVEKTNRLADNLEGTIDNLKSELT
ncbi:MAG: amidohydrolase family protein [Candidatus Bipolaricaulota bacterium]|nr:amidohydrolase family protein [Candidatus Bipolaricaulota bacterium]